ncbi:unnamed protein product [Polarella glacialis]|uniref:CS domain-containing protein n=1 Tax=Polarella glacialis TaxID=89957 RepID=A0A813LFU0_POLGL|nr:unnamed protein product [Polarella glacialis]
MLCRCPRPNFRLASGGGRAFCRQVLAGPKLQEKLLGRASWDTPPEAAWLAWLRAAQGATWHVPTSALVECAEHLSRSGCRDYGLLRELGDQLSRRVEAESGSGPSLGPPTTSEAVRLLRAFAGAACRHRRLLAALSSHVLALPAVASAAAIAPIRRREDPSLAYIAELRSIELVGLIVACGQLQSLPELAEAAIEELSSRSAVPPSASNELGVSRQLALYVQVVHACTRLDLLLEDHSRFWTTIWRYCRDRILQAESPALAGRGEVTVFAASVALQRWQSAICLARATVPCESLRAEPMDLAVWLGSLAVILGLSGDPGESLLPLGAAVLQEALAVFAVTGRTSLDSQSFRRQLLTFALVARPMALPTPCLGSLSDLLTEFEDSSVSHDQKNIHRNAKSRLQQEVLQSLLVVLYTGCSVRGRKWERPAVAVEEPCLTYSLDLVVWPRHEGNEVGQTHVGSDSAVAKPAARKPVKGWSAELRVAFARSCTAFCAADAVSRLKTDKVIGDTCDPEEAADLVKQGWWEAAKELVLASHSSSDASRKASLERVVRREVTALKQRADELLLALSPQDSSRIGQVTCATQWAQNSSAVFLSVKFAHRWSSPGALKVQDEQIGVTDCCFNFSATGDHSQLKKRYALDLHLFDEVRQDRWSWSLASAGRMTVEILKKTPAIWPRLHHSKSKPAHLNLGVWDSMRDRWADDIAKLAKATKAEKSKQDAETVQEASEEDMHEEGQRKCADSKLSPFLRKGDVRRLCSEYWPPKMDTQRMGKSFTWLVLFHSPRAMDCKQMGEECTRVRERWNAVGKKVPEVSALTQVGAVDCDSNADWCKKLDVGNLPFVRRYRAGKRKTYYGEWDIDSIMKFLNE